MSGRTDSYHTNTSYLSPHFCRSSPFGGPCVQHLGGFRTDRDPPTGDVAAVLLSSHAFERLIRWRREILPTLVCRGKLVHHLPLPRLHVLGTVCQSLQSAPVERLRKIFFAGMESIFLASRQLEVDAHGYFPCPKSIFVYNNMY